jgi:hypothetical protein
LKNFLSVLGKVAFYNKDDAQNQNLPPTQLVAHVQDDHINPSRGAVAKVVIAVKDKTLDDLNAQRATQTHLTAQNRVKSGSTGNIDGTNGMDDGNGNDNGCDDSHDDKQKRIIGNGDDDKDGSTNNTMGDNDNDDSTNNRMGDDESNNNDDGGKNVVYFNWNVHDDGLSLDNDDGNDDGNDEESNHLICKLVAKLGDNDVGEVVVQPDDSDETYLEERLHRKAFIDAEILSGERKSYVDPISSTIDSSFVSSLGMQQQTDNTDFKLDKSLEIPLEHESYWKSTTTSESQEPQDDSFG